MTASIRGAGVKVGAATVALCLCLMEVGLRSFYPVADPFTNQRRIEIGAYVPYRHEPDFRLEVIPEPGLPGVKGARTFTTNADGFVGPSLATTSSSTQRVFLVGGSTMEAVVLGNEDNPAALLQAELRSASIEATVINTGHSGDATFDHLAVLTQRILHTSPRVVVFLVGINDLVAIARGERYDHARPDQVVQLGWGAMSRLALTRLHVGRVAWAALGSARLRKWDDTSPSLQTHYEEAANRCRSQPPAPKPPAVDLEGYARNLRALVAVTRAAGATPVLMTQPHSWNDPESEPWWWMNCFGGHRHAPAAMAEALERLNRTTLEVAASTQTPVVDLAAKLTGPRHMYDDVHFNAEGAQQLTVELAEVLVPVLVTP